LFSSSYKNIAMKKFILLLSLAAIAASCGSSHKACSPARKTYYHKTFLNF